MKGTALSRWLCGALLTALGCALTPALAGDDQPVPRDAAEVVQEGDVARWLEHYQRERGADWARQQGTAGANQGKQGAGDAPDPVPAK